MGKRDIRVNYDNLEIVEGKIKGYRDELERLRDAMDTVNTLIGQSNEADSIEKLEKRYKKAKKRLDECYEEANALYKLINGYRREMTSIIQSKGGMTRVGRNDVY